MKGVVKYERGAGFVELREVDEKPLEPNQVRVEVKATGICGSDLHVLHDTINYKIRTPVVMGHEFSGIVVEKGPEASQDISVGDRVTGEPGVYACGQCDYCLSEYPNLCPSRRVIGYWYDGSFARYCDVKSVHRLPPNVGFEAGAVTELLACCVHAVIEQAGVSAGDCVAVTGPGPVGLFASLVALAEGGTVVLFGREADHRRMTLAQELGVQHVVNVDQEDAGDRIRSLTGGYGADVVVECAGSESAIRLALELVRKRGKYSQMGLPGKPVQLDFEQVAYKELSVSGGIAQRRPAWKRALRLMETGSIPAEKLITHEFSLSDWEEAFQITERQEGVKLLLRPE